MPNWCEGTLKVRGNKDDIINFLKNAIKSVGFFGDKDEPEIEENEDYLLVKTSKDNFYLNGTRRGFIEENTIWFEYEREILALEYRQAWGISASELAEISKQYNIDIKIYAYECGMEFNQDIEIHKGEIIRDEEVEFENYMWDCTNPNIGG